MDVFKTDPNATSIVNGRAVTVWKPPIEDDRTGRTEATLVVTETATDDRNGSRRRDRRRNGTVRSALYRAGNYLNAALLIVVALTAIIQVTVGRPDTASLVGSSGAIAPSTGTATAVTFAGGQLVTAPVATGDLLVRVAATGTVEPARLVEVSTELSGTIKAVHVDTNDVVKAGDLLAELHSDTLSNELARAKAVVAAARSKIEEASAESVAARRQFDRQSKLAEKQLASERSLDLARAESAKLTASIAALRSELAIAEANFAIARSAMNKARIVAPIDGIVLRRNVEPGQTVAASLQAPVLFRIAENLDRMQIRVDVDEADALLVKAGQPASFSVQALREQNQPAKVEKLFVGPEIVQGVVTYKAILSFDNSRINLKPGMTASAEIVVSRVDGGLLVPNAALRFSPPDTTPAGAAPTGVGVLDSLIGSAAPSRAVANSNGDTPPPDASGRVFVVENGRLKPVFIGIGASDGTRTEIVSGPLKPGQRVVVDIAPERRTPP